MVNMQKVRSLIYVFLFVFWSTFIVVLNAIFLPFPRSVAQATIRLWMFGTMLLLRVVIGLHYEIRGMERIPEGPVIFASKHQSAWDTAIYYMFDRDPAYIFKKELLKIPLYGLTLRKAGHIAIDRDGGMSTLKHVMRETRRAIQERRRVIIFPEGTRTLPGDPGTYQPGVASGYMKYPGSIFMEFLPPIPAGLNRKVFMKELQQQVNEASERLRLEAESKYGLEPATIAEI
jgi:1-acyl-sn-glycerol-3-phosphate acyltransferase